MAGDTSTPDAISARENTPLMEEEPRKVTTGVANGASSEVLVGPEIGTGCDSLQYKLSPGDRPTDSFNEAQSPGDEIVHASVPRGRQRQDRPREVTKYSLRQRVNPPKRFLKLGASFN